MSLQEPLRFRPRAFPKVWGGRRLAEFVPGGLEIEGPVGEVWELVERDGCSSEVQGGTFDGRRLSGLMLSERADLLGEARPSLDDRFPLLIKYIDAEQPLSVQVHPDARTAERLGGEPKDECWYILHAEPQAVVYLGLEEGVDAKTFAAEARSHHVVDLLREVEVRAGEFLAVPAGTVHAIGAGVTLVEVQENADTTWRVFDWDRVGLDGQPRPLHLDEALQAIDYERAPEGPLTPSFSPGVNGVAALHGGDAFGVEMLRINEPLECSTHGRPVIYVVLSGKGLLVTETGEWRLGKGETWLLPAAMGTYRFTAADGELEVLRVEAR
jgi:mannose-6-phosphate isomerase